METHPSSKILSPRKQFKKKNCYTMEHSVGRTNEVFDGKMLKRLSGLKWK